MREESHLDDMRSAIRGDFERLAERRGGQELMSVDDEPPERDVGDAEPDPELTIEAVAPPAPEPEPEPEPTAEPEPPLAEPALEPEPEPVADERRGSWLDRLFGR